MLAVCRLLIPLQRGGSNECPRECKRGNKEEDGCSPNEGLLRETFTQLLKAMGEPDEADGLADSFQLAHELPEIVPQPDGLPDDFWHDLILGCQKLAELRKIRLYLLNPCLGMSVMKDCVYACCDDANTYVNIKIDENAFIHDTITALLHKSQ